MAITSLQINQANSYITQLANLLGISSWDLQPATYNGISFLSLLKPGGFNLDALNNINPAGSLTNSILSLTNNNNSNQNLLGTKLSISNANDIINKKLGVIRIPNSNTNVIEDQGTDGFMMSLYGIFVGPQYKTAMENFMNAANNPDQVDPKNLYVLGHPIWGNIQKAYISNIKWLHSNHTWRATTYQFDFITATIPSFQPDTSLQQTIGKYFMLVQQTITALAQTINDANLIGGAVRKL